MNDAPNATAKRSDTENSGGHWYGFENGRAFPLYAEGKTFTLREARKLKKEGKAALPSVTTYFKNLHKQSVVDYLMERTAEATLRHPRSDYASDREWLDVVTSAADGASKGAMDLGTRIHKGLEHGLEGGSYDADLDVYLKPTFAALKEIGFQMIEQEVCVASPAYGYAGKVDLVEPMGIADAKSRKTKAGEKPRGYPTDLIQLIAYGVARFGLRFLQEGRCRNIIISTSEPGRVEILEHKPEKFAAAWEAFLGLTAIWRFTSNFDPRS